LFSHRCSLAGVDLNRQYTSPSPHLHPEVHAVKQLLLHATRSSLRPFVFVDMHGHSKRFNAFMYGNDAAQSWMPAERRAAAGDLDVSGAPQQVHTVGGGKQGSNPIFSAPSRATRRDRVRLRS
jgi:hypothetical protein